MDALLQLALFPRFGDLPFARFGPHHLNLGYAARLPFQLYFKTYGYFVHSCAYQSESALTVKNWADWRADVPRSAFGGRCLAKWSARLPLVQVHRSRANFTRQTWQMVSSLF